MSFGYKYISNSVIRVQTHMGDKLIQIMKKKRMRVSYRVFRKC